MNKNGYALALGLLPGQHCEGFIGKYDDSNRYCKIITMERHGVGLGEYKYFKYPLSDIIETIRKQIHSKLTTVANTWMKTSNIERRFPNQFEEFQGLCHYTSQI